MARRAKLPVAPRDVQMTEQIFVKVALHVVVILRNLHRVDFLADFDEQIRFVDFELGVLHLNRKRAFAAADHLQRGKTFSLTCFNASAAGRFVQ